MRKSFRYEQIAAELKQAIAQGKFEGQKLPSERALMAEYGVQRDTVRKALSLLRADGSIVGSGQRRSFANVVPAPSPGESRPHSPTTGAVLVITRMNEASTALESLLRGLAHALRETQLSILYFDARPRQGRTVNEMPSDEYLAANSVVGIVLWPQSPADLEALQRLRAYAPLVLIDQQVSGFQTHSVVFDDFHGARAVTNHLIELGHRRIGFLGDEVFAETVQKRWRGYCVALESAGIAPDPTCYALFQGIDSPNYSAQMQIFLRGAGQPLTAVVCSNDTVAMGLVHFLRRKGLRVPEDVAVTGFGNLLPNSMDAMRLTTVLQPFEDVGKSVGVVLLANIGAPEDRRAISDFVHIEVPVEIVVRASSESTRRSHLHNGIRIVAETRRPPDDVITS